MVSDERSMLFLFDILKTQVEYEGEKIDVVEVIEKLPKNDRKVKQAIEKALDEELGKMCYYFNLYIRIIFYYQKF